MEKEKFKLYYYSAIGVILFIGFLFFLINISSSGYYQKEYYNNLPSLQPQVVQTPSVPKPEAIQHYEGMRDESVRETEKANQISNNTITIGNINQYFVPLEDGRLNYKFLLFTAIFTLFYVTRIKLPFVPTMHSRMNDSLINTLFIILMMVVISSMIHP